MKTKAGAAPGFTLVELLIVVAIIAIIAAIAVPALLRARVSANESATIGDVRTVISGQAAYQSANAGWYDSKLPCLAQRGGCIPSAPSTSPTFLDSNIASLAPKSGYMRSVPQVGPGPLAPDAAISASSVSAYVYAAVPIAPGMSGVRGFGGDDSGRVCATQTGAVPPLNGAGSLAPNCESLR